MHVISFGGLHSDFFFLKIGGRREEKGWGGREEVGEGRGVQLFPRGAIRLHGSGMYAQGCLCCALTQGSWEGHTQSRSFEQSILYSYHIPCVHSQAESERMVHCHSVVWI